MRWMHKHFKKPEEALESPSEFDYDMLFLIVSLVAIVLIILTLFYFYKKGRMGRKNNENISINFLNNI